MVELMHDEATLLPEEGQRDGAQVLDPSTTATACVESRHHVAVISYQITLSALRSDWSTKQTSDRR